MIDDGLLANSDPPAPSARTEYWRRITQDPLIVAFFFSLLLLGGDWLSIDFGGLHFRLVFPVLMATILLLYLKLNGHILFDKTLSLLFLLLALSGALSTANSEATVKSVGYTIWVLFDFFVVVSVCYNFSRLYLPELVLTVWLLVFRTHAILTFVEFARNLVAQNYARPHLWFYEPSYLAVFMTGYFGAALYLVLERGRKYLVDIALAALSMLTLSSATALFGIFFATLLNFLIARQRLKLMLWSGAIIGSVLGGLFAFFSKTRYFALLVGFLFQEDALRMILERGGDRWIRVLIGWDAFVHHPWLGVGIGGDEAYMHIAEYPEEAVRLIQPLTDVRGGEPFCNIFVEILGTTGIVGFIPFIAILGYAAWSMSGLWKKIPPPREAVVFFAGFFSTLLAMQLDGTVLRYYVWSSLGLAFGVLARARAIEVSASTDLVAPINGL